uniref:Uncharacterized protein n=1 Tax=Panagrolaimus sp. PS1159 TaxID=55785 RepID=A0AC35F239_9BILA
MSLSAIPASPSSSSFCTMIEGPKELILSDGIYKAQFYFTMNKNIFTHYGCQEVVNSFKKAFKIVREAQPKATQIGIVLTSHNFETPIRQNFINFDEKAFKTFIDLLVHTFDDLFFLTIVKSVVMEITTYSTVKKHFY